MLSCVSLDFYFYFIALYETFKITSRFLFVLFCYFLILFLNRNLPLYTGTFTKQIYSGSTHGSGHHPVHLPREYNAKQTLNKINGCTYFSCFVLQSVQLFSWFRCQILDVFWNYSNCFVHKSI